MTYTKQTWEDSPSEATPLSAGRLGHIEDGVEDAHDTIDTHVADTGAHSGGGAHPDLATHDALGLATDAELTTHAADTTAVHGIADTSVLETTTGAQAKVDTHAAVADPHTGYVLESLFDANTILKADSDNTPAALTVAEQTLVGRVTAGSIDDLSVAQVLTLLGRTDENVQDLVGAMVSGGTEAGIAVTYDDTNARLDFTVTVTLTGTLAARPAAAASNDGWLYLATDVRGGTQYRSNGSAWVQAAAGVLADTAAAVQFVRKTGDESVTSSTTLQNDDHLFLSVEANSTYEFAALLFYDAGTTGDIKVGATIPASATIAAATFGASASATTLTSNTRFDVSIGSSAGGHVGGGIGAGSKMHMLARGTVRTGATAGTFQIQWAQSGSDATATTVFTESYLLGAKVA